MNFNSNPEPASLAVASVPLKTVSQWVEHFELALRDGRGQASLSGQLRQSPAGTELPLTDNQVLLADYLPHPTNPQHDEIATEVMRVYLEWNWERGKTETFDELISEISWLSLSPNLLSQVAFEDYRLRSNSIHSRSPEHYRKKLNVDISRWHDWQVGAENRLGSQLTATESGLDSTLSGLSYENLSSTDAASGSCDPALGSLPVAGETLGDFALLLMIGEGAFSRVFVAKQKSLADRLIVLKVTRTPLGESQHLARLQHSNIMPLYSAHRVGGLFLLVMPFLGSVTLKELIDLRFRDKNSERPAADRLSNIAEYLSDRRQELFHQLANFEQSKLLDDNLALQSRLDEFLGGLAWETGILRIFVKLADGLSYAHRRGIQQRDIKPANVLLGFDGQPILLDFNLSRMGSAESLDIARAVGGTLSYMAPEHRVAMETGIDQLTPAADIFSIGIVLQESLTGIRPKLQSLNLSGSVEPGRVTSSSALPMTPVRPSRAIDSIIAKCIEPNPSDRYESAEALQIDLQQHQADRPLRFANNPSPIERWQKFRRRNRRLFSSGGLILISVAMSLIAGAFGYIWWKNLRMLDARERYGDFIRAVHLAEAELFLADGGGREQGKQLVRSLIKTTAVENGNESDYSWLNHLDETRQQDISQIRDYLTRLLHQDNPNNIAALSHEPAGQATRLEAATAAYFRRDFAAALEILEAEIRIHPQRFLNWFLKGKCQFELRDYREAERSFAMALTVQPDSVPSLVAQGMSHFWLTQFSAASVCFQRALELDPHHFAANYNLALVLEKQNRFSEALEVLAHCEKMRKTSTRVWMTRSRIARQAGDNRLADESLNLSRETEPDEPDGWVLRGLARLTESPEAALADFAKAQTFPTTRFSAGQNRAHVLSEFLKRPAEAVEVLTDLINADPHFLPGLAGRAVLQARLKNSKSALADIELLRQKSLTPQLHYQIACVYALLSEAEPEYEKKALDHLAVAAQPAYGGPIIAADKDLDLLRKNANFKAILQGIETVNLLRVNQ